MCCGIRCPYCHKLFEFLSDYKETNDYLNMSDSQKVDYLEKVYKHKCEQRIVLERGDENK
jgi:hypothetical protein